MRHGRRQFRPAVAGLEGRQLLSATPLSTVATFSGSSKPQIGGLVMDAQGDLFGTTSAGGEGHGAGIGTVFEIPAGTNTITTLASFNGRTGYGISGLSIDSKGDLFGTIAGEGGTIGNGSAFEIAAGTKDVITLASFNKTGGLFPDGVVPDAKGDLFGTAAIGGAQGVASAYEIPAGTSTIVPIANFGGTAPAPKGVVMDAQGNFYGTDQGGGPYGAGSIYEIAKGSGVVTPLVTFNGIDGPGISGPTVDAQGNLYGTTQDGGAFGDGTVFEIPKGSNTAVTIATFDGPNGAEPDPAVGVVRDAQGDLFGTTESGGPNGASQYGTVYEVPAGSNTVITLASFANSRQDLVTSLLLDGQGNLVGTTDGGAGFSGTVFKVALNNQAAKS